MAVSYLKSLAITAEDIRSNMKNPAKLIADPCKQEPKVKLTTLDLVAVGNTFTIRQNGKEVTYRKISNGDGCQVVRLGPGRPPSSNLIWPSWTIVAV